MKSALAVIIKLLDKPIKKSLPLARLRRVATSPFVGLICAGLLTCVPVARAQTNPPSRPVIFVHGWCGDTSSWQPLSSYLFQQLQTAFPTLYVNPPAGASASYDIYYDSSIDSFGYFDPSGATKFESDIPSSTRLFNIRFYDSADASFDATKVAGISILNKAFELSKVIKQVTAITHIKDVILVAHSMGGLVSRAYIENMASSGQCSQNNMTDYNNGACSPGVGSDAAYGGEVADLITIDTPHAGSPLAIYADVLPKWGAQCFITETENADELIPQANGGPGLIEALNYNGAGIGTANATPTENIVTIQSFEDYISDVFAPWDDYFHVLDGYSDDIVPLNSQSISNLPSNHTAAKLQDVPYSYVSTDLGLANTSACWFSVPFQGTQMVLHVIDCVGAQHQTPDLPQPRTADGVYSQIAPAYVNGALTNINVQATLDQKPWSGQVTYTVAPITDTQCTNSPSGCRTATVIPPPATFVSDWAPGLYTVTNVSGGPSTNVVLPAAFVGQNPGDWNITLSLDFYSSLPPLPVVATAGASPVYSNDAILNGNVNPEGNPATAWFEWGTDSTLSNFQPTAQQSIPPGNTTVALTFDQGELSSNTTYYYRVAASNGGGTQRGLPVSFVTLGSLSSPSLSAPTNGSIGVTTTPTFSWSTVSGATSYRILIATSPSSLPTDPSSSTCGTGCVLSATPTSTAYTPASGILFGGTTYYWEVSATASGQNGNWSGIFSFSTSGSAQNDFSMQITPPSQSVNASGTVAYAISTNTTSGTAQTVELGISGLPTGVTALFTPSLITSGGTAIVGLTTSSATPLGNYSITVIALGSAATHTAAITLVVTSNTGAPGVSFSPQSLAFSDQTQYTTGPSQLVTYTNTGTASLQVLAIVGDTNFVVQNACINTLPPGTSCTFSVASDPSVTGPMSGTAGLYFAGTGSPAVLPLRGNGLAPPPTSGTIQVNGTLNGQSLSNWYAFDYVLTGPATYNGGGAYTFTVTPGTYTASFSGFPPDLTLAGIVPSTTQTVAAGGVVTFTMNFTAPDDFYGPYFGQPVGGGFSPQIAPAGTAANYAIGDPNPPPGNASTLLTLQLLGIPYGVNATFNPQPMYSGTGSALTVTTVPSTPMGAYTLSLTGTNSSGLAHPGSNTSTLVVTVPPSQPVQLASLSTGGVQGNGPSDTNFSGGVSADGRYVAFASQATNLVSNDNNGFQDIFVRDRQGVTTTLASVSSTGIQADYPSIAPAISGNGRYVVFQSGADNLVQGTTLGTNAVYLRDLQQGLTEREDISSGGTPANAASYDATISWDGRYVAFISLATNLVSGVTTGTPQIYVRDRNTGLLALASAASDGSPANGYCLQPALSADGRFVAFVSAATNLTSLNTNGKPQLFVRDLQANATILASVAKDGTAANQGVATYQPAFPPAISADGRFVVFVSSSTNLISQQTDGVESHVFVRNMQSQQTTIVDSDMNGVPLGWDPNCLSPTISADGRFIAYTIYNQILMRDTSNNQTVALSVASDGTVANGNSGFAALSPGGAGVAFSSAGSNLVSGDGNNVADSFFIPNPLLVTPYAQSLTLNSSPIGGGSTVTGTVTLSGPAPANGATVLISSDNAAAQVPAFVLVPSGATGGTFTFDTSVVGTETVMTVMGSYDGGSAAALLTLEPAPALAIAPTTWDFGGQPVGTTSTPNVFAVTNTGTATLVLNSESMGSGQVFHAITNTCGTSLAPGATCSISVVFGPTTAGSAADTLQISYSSPAVVQSLPVSGTGTTPLVSMAPASVSFGSHSIPSTTSSTVTLTNVGSGPLTNVAASITGANTADFSISSDSCSGTVLPANSSCLITVTFSPQAAGLRSASLSVSDNAVGSPQTAGLSGTGATPLTVSPTALSYGNQGISSTSAAKKVTLTNNTGAVVTISSMVISGTNSSDFVQSATTCGTTLALNKSCTISITFTPAASGARSATLTLTDSAVNSPQPVPLSGTGVLQVTLSTATFTFGNQVDGSTSAPKTVTLTNNTSAVLSISSVATTGTNATEFGVSSNACGASIGGHSSCKISVTFAPVTPGAKTAALTITDSANNSPQSVNLTGTGIVPVSVTPSSLIFPAQTVGTTSTAKTVTIKNNLPTALTMSGNTFTGANAADFGQSATTCGATLAAGAKCTVSITFKPTAKGTRLAVLDVADSAITSPQAVSLSGTGK